MDAALVDARLHNPVSGDLVSFHLIFVQVSTFSDILFCFVLQGSYLMRLRKRAGTFYNQHP
jgi:hypothetical protein